MKKILCIEDELFISELYLRALLKAGYDAKAVSNGEEALVEAKTNAYDIILLDLMVPGISGIEILHRLRDPNLQPPLKSRIIVTTNLNQTEDIRAKIEAMADGYLIKAEFTPKLLVEFLNQVQ